jgi:hypothetical protein
MANRVEVFDPPEFGGWIWRYDLAPVTPSQTEVTLTYDWLGCRRICASTSNSHRSTRSIWTTC